MNEHLSGDQQHINRLVTGAYDAGWVTAIDTETLPPGLDEAVIRAISARKSEPHWMTEWRLQAYQHWLTMSTPQWAHVQYPPIDYQAISYYSAPKSSADGPKSLDEVDPELLRTYEKLGIPLHEQQMLAGVAVDAVFDSVSVVTTFREKLAEAGVVFCPISEALHSHPELVRKYLGTVVPRRDNFYAALNSAVFSDGSFVYIPPGVRCPMELSTYFRINERNTGQFERTLIIADEGSEVSYLEGCTAPMRDENQLHAAVVELVAHKDARIKYSTVQNWYPGDNEGRGGIYNFVTKRGLAHENAHISWTQVETGSAITWKYPSVILRGDNSVGRVLFGGPDPGPAAGRYGHQDDSSGQKHPLYHHCQGHQRHARPTDLSRAGAGSPGCRAGAQFHPMRLPAHRRCLRRPYHSLYRKPPPDSHTRARGYNLQSQ